MDNETDLEQDPSNGRNVKVISYPSIHNRRAEVRKKQFVSKLNNLVEASYHRPDLTISYLASQQGISERGFHRKCKEYFQMTPKRYINEFRLNEAVRMITEGRAIGSISYDVGFSTPSSFGRSFKLRFGSSPRKYALRSSKIKNNDEMAGNG